MARSGAYRGGIVVNSNTLYGAWDGEVYTVTTDGETRLFDTLAGTSNPHFGKNNAATPDVAITVDNTAYILDISGAQISAYPDGDVGSPTTCCGYLGYLFFGYGDGTMRVTSFNSTAINTLDQANTASNPDGILRMFGYNGQIYAMGDVTVEVWGEPINPTGFPLTRAGFNILPGLLSADAVAGWEPEWGYPPIWVGSDGTVRQLVGYQAVKISTSDIDRDIQSVDAVDVGDINCLVYNAGGHAFWQVNLPTKSWVFHVNERSWHERKSQDLSYSRLLKSNFFAEKWVVGNKDTTDLVAMSIAEPLEAGRELTAQMTSGPAKDFPYRQRVVRADFDFTAGVGIPSGLDPEQVDPTVHIEVSYDGGRNWPHLWQRKLGKQDATVSRVFVNNAGLSGARGPRWRWTISDPISIGFKGSDMASGGLSK